MAVITVPGMFLTGDHASRPAATAVGGGSLYACSTHGLIYQSDTSSWTTWATLGSTGTVATDTIWDAAGDLAVGSGANTAAKLAAGSEDDVLTVVSGVPAWAAPAASPGGSVLYPLDDITLHGTYGDHFDAATLDAKWTRRVLPNPAEYFADSWMHIAPIEGTNFGHLQSWTPTDEAEIQLAASALIQGDEGIGVVILSAAGTGVYLGWRAANQGLQAVTTYSVSGTTSQGWGHGSGAGAFLLGTGQKIWLSLIKKSNWYFFRFSFDGATWTQPMGAWTPTGFTPSQIGWLSGAADSGNIQSRNIRIDWFNVVNEKSLGNNLMITPTSGTVTPTVGGTAFSGAAADVIDGDTASAEWIVTNATQAWFNAAFSVAQDVNRLRLYGYDHDWGSGYVEFSSGTKIPFYQNNGNMKDLFLDFPTESTTFIKVWAHMLGNGSFLGWREIEAYLAS